MIDVTQSPALEIAIEGSLSRIRERAAELGPAFGALGEAIAGAARGGKRFRPALVAASFDAFDAPDRHAAAVLSVATAFELLHAAFVVHDDVIDHDLVRRGVPNVAGRFRLRGRQLGADADGAAQLGDAAAILAGDLLLHEAVRLVAMADVDADVRERLLTLLDDAVFVSAAGELADVENSVAPDCAPVEQVFDAAFNKTAVYSFRAPLQAGAVLGGASPEAIVLLGHAGGRLGLAFQLVDDLIGAFGSPEQAGRESGGDLREAKRTPLVALARESADATRLDATLALARTGPVAVRDARRALDASGARGRLRDMITDTLSEVRATSRGDDLTPAAGELLREIADGIEGRIP
ncbi:polyprenyl synthetase family protein [Microbacterium yannicii]|uniref:polyprenyl synthetase family protein n=1 Tax=Microbacterium yannicii TaxID=671622 RepID=UPI00030AE689|nr:polyprenyl synthetase family protein [Microbacterium yannicii]